MTNMNTTSKPRFYDLAVKKIQAEAADSVAITFSIPDDLHDVFYFEPGQFLTLKAHIEGEEVRRTYSISSARSRYHKQHELEVGIRAVEGGLFSHWAAHCIKVGDSLSVMPPEGRFVVKKNRALHRVGFAAGSGITPILSIAATTLEEQPNTQFTLVYGNRRTSSVMFNEALQDLKDRFPDRLTLIHVLSQQAQEVDLLQGRITGAKVNDIVAALLPAASMDEVFICGPEEMIDATEASLLALQVPQERIYTERFNTASNHHTQNTVRLQGVSNEADTVKDVDLTVVLDGVRHDFKVSENDFLLDAALHLGLDLPYSCKAGVCCTCRAKVLEGTVRMDKNFTLEEREVNQGFVLSCQAKPQTKRVVLSYDER